MYVLNGLEIENSHVKKCYHIFVQKCNFRIGLSYGDWSHWVDISFLNEKSVFTWLVRPLNCFFPLSYFVLLKIEKVFFSNLFCANWINDSAEAINQSEMLVWLVKFDDLIDDHSGNWACDLKGTYQIINLPNIIILIVVLIKPRSIYRLCLSIYLSLIDWFCFNFFMISVWKALRNKKFLYFCLCKLC